MHFAIVCLDKPGQAQLRAEHRPAHLEYLKANERRILIVGPLLDEAGKAPLGSLLILDFDDLAAAQAFADDDPYRRAGLFESVTIRPWRQVFPA